MTAGGCGMHRWTPWRMVERGLLERRCPCGSVERGTPETLVAEALGEHGEAFVVSSREDEPPHE